VRASAKVEVARRGSRDMVVDARSEPPMSIRCTPGRILVVGSAAAPVGGDELEIDVIVGPGATARFGTAAATVVWPGPGGAASSQRTRIVVAENGHVEWRPEPMVSVAGSVHRTRTDVDLSATATAWIVEETSLGRSGECSGRLDLELRVTRDGTPLVHHVEHLGPDVPGWGSAVHVGPARHLLTGLMVGPLAGDPLAIVADHLRGASAARLPIAADVTMVMVVSPDRPTAHTLLRTVCPDLSG
jgi:urease accessory protein